MGIFKNITKTLKQAAPVIGSAIGMYFGGPAGAALGSGIGSLAAGKDAEEALKAAALAGGTAYLSGYGKGFKKMPSDATADARFFGGSEVTDSPTVTAIQKAQAPTSFFDKAIDFAKSGPGIATLGGLGTLALLGGEEEKKTTGSDMPSYPVGKTRLGYGRIGDKFYNLDDEEERKQYFEDNRKREENEDDVGIMTAAIGGEVTGPGTGTSDSVPARLSDGEFVLTAKAVRGAGGGDRDLGAARMYDMMSSLERVA